MTDRPSTAGSTLGATLAGEVGAPGYYPDPSVPGFLRYWAGHAWVPGTSRPAPAPGEPLDPPRFVARYLTAPPYNPPPGLVPAAPTGPLVETGPIYFDETTAQAVFAVPVHPEPTGPEPTGPVPTGPGGGPDAGPGTGTGSGAGEYAATAGPGELEVRPRNAVEPLRPVEAAPWAVAGSGLQPVTAESWATAAALNLGAGAGAGPDAPAGAVVAPQGGREVRGVRGVEPAVRPLELPVPVAEEPEPRAAQPLGGTPWHGAGGDGGDGSVGLSAGPGALFEPVPTPEQLTEALSEPEPEPSSADPASGWRADPQAQRGLMETGGAPRWVSWGVEQESASEPVPEPAPTPQPAPEPEPEPEPVRTPAAAKAQPPGREPRTAHVTSERVRPPRRAAEPAAPRTGASARRPAPAAGVGKRRPAAPAPVPAGVGARAFGWLVDGAVTAVVGAAVAVPLAGTVRAHVQQKIDQAELAARMTGRQHQVWLLDGTVLGRVGVLLGVLLVFGLLYQVLPIARTGQTFGKRLARVRVVAAGGAGAPGFGRSLVRWLVRGLGTAVLLGPAAALLDRTARRGWHDRAARTRVVRVERG
ncbi:RDD family protein [Kitasatospora sp. NPDC090308]|uniref:RDD family protein n=1 Tax=Kitasatospora sp. NPDC090308 TaxID=3364082 RepID=UPI0037FA438D